MCCCMTVQNIVPLILRDCEKSQMMKASTTTVVVNVEVKKIRMDKPSGATQIKRLKCTLPVEHTIEDSRRSYSAGTET